MKIMKHYIYTSNASLNAIINNEVIELESDLFLKFPIMKN